jgi:hypothetical protein
MIVKAKASKTGAWEQMAYFWEQFGNNKLFYGIFGASVRDEGLSESIG